MIVIIDYGMGNLRSAQKGFEKAGHSAIVSERPADLAGASGIVLPGVGAFRDCYEGLRKAGFVDPLREAVEEGRPLLGICVGMQLLFDEGTEGTGSPGLGFLPGRVIRFPEAAETGLKVPHMGWNLLKPVPGRACCLLNALSDTPYLYFVHSYYPVPSRPEIVYATTAHGVEFAAVVGKGNIFGTQFHPEKSGTEGIGILKAFGDCVHEAAKSATV